MRDSFAILAVTAVATATLSACSSPPTKGPASDPAASAASTPTLPPRPREIDLRGVEVCSLLTQDQQRQLGTDTPPEAGVDTSSHGNPYCDYSKVQSSPRFSYQVTIVPDEDAAIYLTNKRNAVAQVVSAAGFPAVQAHRPTDDRGCFVLVSTKPGQYFDVQYAESTGSNDSTEVACEKARVAAEMATQTLLAQR